MEAVFAAFIIAVLALGAMIVFASIQGLLVMLCWNFVVPVIFVSAPELNFLQSCALALLTSVLFKSSLSINNKSN